MKLGVFLSDYRGGNDVVDRLTADKLGIILVGNGIYRATVKEGGEDPIFKKGATLYALAEDVESRGFTAAQLDKRVKAVTYSDVVDLIFNDYEKIIWV